jgi:hypothetical protein
MDTAVRSMIFGLSRQAIWQNLSYRGPQFVTKRTKELLCNSCYFETEGVDTGTIDSR